jgi:hypothetical protein
MRWDIMWLSYPEQVAEEACIKEIKLRTLDDPLRKILMVRRKEMNGICQIESLIFNQQIYFDLSGGSSAE